MFFPFISIKVFTALQSLQMTVTYTMQLYRNKTNTTYPIHRMNKITHFDYRQYSFTDTYFKYVLHRNNYWRTYFTRNKTSSYTCIHIYTYVLSASQKLRKYNFSKALAPIQTSRHINWIFRLVKVYRTRLKSSFLHLKSYHFKRKDLKFEHFILRKNKLQRFFVSLSPVINV